MDSVYEVMEVLKTVSPKRDSAAPNAVPVNECPVFRCRVAGARVGRAEFSEAVSDPFLPKPVREGIIEDTVA